MNTQSTEKRRAVAYCRVSTDKEEQQTSIKSQRTELRRMCERKKWVMPNINVTGLCSSGVYYDIGTSGTKLSRPAFDRLLVDAGLTPVIDADTEQKTTAYKVEKPPIFDLIVVKDASRFSRNVSINSILQTLKDNHVYVYFSDLQMTTEVNEHWNIIQQFFIFAEGESRRKSTAVKWGYNAGVRAGKIYFGGKMIGYDYDSANNRLIVNKEEAKVVKRVFDMYTEEGLGQYRICNALAEEGYFNSAGKKYTRSTIKRMLQNEKYCGITNSGRYTKIDLFSGKRIIRAYDDELRVAARKAQKELEAQGVIKIEPIITVEQFQKAQQITAHNSEMYKVSKEWHGTTDYCKKVVCGTCGAFYRASGRKMYKKYEAYGSKISRYVCKHRISYDEEHGIPKCDNPAILEPELDKALFSNQYWVHRRLNIEDLIDTGAFYIRILQSAIDADNESTVKVIDSKIEEVKKKRDRLLDLYADGIFDKEELTRRTSAFTDTINELALQREQLSKDNNAIQKDIEEIQNLISAAEAELKEVLQILEKETYPEKTRRELLRDVDHILIDKEGAPHIVFKSLENIKRTATAMGIMIESYAEAEESGWEEELAEAEKEGAI